MPVHIVTTDIVTGETVVLSEGSAAEAIVASTAIPGAFAPIKYKNRYLADGAISSNTPIRVAIDKGAERLIIVPTGFACSGTAPPVGAVANVLHALTLLISRQMTTELEYLEPTIEYYVFHRCARWSARPTISAAATSTSRGPSGAPRRGSPTAGWRRAAFLARCVHTATDRCSGGRVRPHQIIALQ